VERVPHNLATKKGRKRATAATLEFWSSRMTASINVPVAHQDESNHPRFFVYLRNGTLRAIKVLGDEAPLVVWYRGQYRVVFSRMETDEEYFRNHPEMQFRLKVYRSRRYAPDYFTFKITTRIGVYAVGDRWDFRDYDANRYGSPREYLISESKRMLANSNRCSGSERWLASQGTHQ
jgi:hypothetical protein